MDAPLLMSNIYPSFSKSLKIEYSQTLDGFWRCRSHLRDPIYNVVVTLDMSAPDFVVRDASVRFLNYPRKECVKAAPKVKELIGADLRLKFREILQREYLGPGGCDTIFNLINVSCRSFVIRYLVWQRGLGAITAEEYRTFGGGVKCVVALGYSRFPEAFAPRHCVPGLPEPDATPNPIPPRDWLEGEPVFDRQINVDIFELSQDLWQARVHIVDFQHNIVLVLDVSTAELVVQDAKLTWLRQPYDVCGWMEERISKIVGACLATDYRRRVGRDFTLDEGCGNVYGMLNLVPKGFLQYYLWRNTVKKRLSPEQEALCKKGLKQDCIACGL